MMAMFDISGRGYLHQVEFIYWYIEIEYVGNFKKFKLCVRKVLVAVGQLLVFWLMSYLSRAFYLSWFDTYRKVGMSVSASASALRERLELRDTWNLSQGISGLQTIFSKWEIVVQGTAHPAVK